MEWRADRGQFELRLEHFSTFAESDVATEVALDELGC